MKKKIFVLIILSLFLIMLILGICIKKEESIIIEKTEPQNIQQIIFDCKNLDLFETSYCFRDNIKTFFEYNDNKIEIFEENGILKIRIMTNNTMTVRATNQNLLTYLKENGGSCSEWSLLYKKLCENTKYECSTVINEGVFKVFNGHEYAVMYNSTHYCKLDQTIVKCFKIKEVEYAK